MKHTTAQKLQYGSLSVVFTVVFIALVIGVNLIVSALDTSFNLRAVSYTHLIGFLPEQPPLYMDMTVKEYLNFVYGLKNCRLPRAQHIKEICEVVRKMCIRDSCGTATPTGIRRSPLH